MTTTTVSQEAVEVTQADRDALEAIDDALGFLMDNEREIVLAALARHRQQAEREEEEAHKIGIDEGRQEMAREIDLATGGDGEFRYCMNGDPDRHCPDAEAMKVRVLDRFAALTIQRAFEERERKLREALRKIQDEGDARANAIATQALKETPDAQ